MSIYIDAEVAAIAKRILTLFPTIKQYYLEIPEGFTRPSIYFERPSEIGSVFSNTMYRNTHSLQIKVFDKKKEIFDGWEAAGVINDDIIKKRHLVQMIDNIGDPIDNYIRILSFERREITENSFNVIVKWNSLFKYEVDAATLMQNITVNADLKE